MSESSPKIILENLQSENILEVDKSLPQTPKVPWDDYLAQNIKRFRYLKVEEDGEEWPPKFPNLPSEYRKMYFDIPHRTEEIEEIVAHNKVLRSVIGSDSTKVFYRPGIGYGGALNEILEKMGTYRTMIITDPVYAEKKMTEWSKGILPIDYYIKTLNLLNAENIEIKISSNLVDPGTTADIKTEIPTHGVATISCKINGVDLEFQLLTEDMTKFHPSHYDIVGFGQPTPTDPDNVKDPRYSENFVYDTIHDLSMGGIVDYSESSIRFLPKDFSPEVFGFQEVGSGHIGNKKFIRKVEDLGETLKKVFEITENIVSLPRVFAGKMPSGGWVGFYYADIPNEKGEKNVTSDDIIELYKTELFKIKDILSSLPDQKVKMIVEKMEELYMDQISTNADIDLDKVETLGQNKPNTYGGVERLAEEHAEGKIDVVDFYQKLIQIYYEIFPKSL